MFRLDSAPADRVIRMGQNHLYLRPHPSLRDAIAHYTITFTSLKTADEAAGPLTLMPDIGGCFVFTPWEPREDLFWGANTSAVVVRRDFGNTPMRFFVEFRPGGAYRLLGAPMRALADEKALLADVLPDLYARMQDILYREQDVGTILPRVDALFLAGLAAREGYDEAAPLARLLAGLQSAVPVRELAAQTGYSERHLGRLFHASFGVGVKACTRVIRIHRMLDLLARPTAPLALLAQQAGYYDQAHLDHDFKAVCGVSPSEYLASMSDFYKESYKY